MDAMGGPQQREQNQKSKPTLGVTMMHHATKRGFKDCPGFLNSTGRLGPRKRAEMLHHPCILGGPQQRGTKSELKSSVTGHHDAPRGPWYLKVWVSSTARRPNTGEGKILYGGFSAGENSAWGIFRTCPKNQGENSAPPKS